MCVPYPMPGYLAELEIESCRPPDEDAAFRKLNPLDAGPDFSPEAYVHELLTEHQGVIVTARVLRTRVLFPEQTGLRGKI